MLKEHSRSVPKNGEEHDETPPPSPKSPPLLRRYPYYIGIFATSSNCVIGCNNKLPWFIPEDLNFFRKLTYGHIVIMGRRTFESLPYSCRNGFPGRINIILTREEPLMPPTAQEENEPYYANMENLPAILDIIHKIYPGKSVFVVGGSTIFTLFAPLINEWYITQINKNYLGETVFRPDLSNFVEEKIKDFYSSNENCRVFISKWVRRAEDIWKK